MENWGCVFRRLGHSTSTSYAWRCAEWLEVQSGDTILTSQVPDPATELTIREYVRACKRGSGPAKAKDSLPFEFLLTVPACWVDTSLSESAPIALVCMTVLNWWLVTREMEASAARVIHVTFDHDRCTGGCYLRRNATHMQLVKFALTTVVAPMRSAILCVRFFVQYFALLAARFGPGFDTVQSNLPLFPARNGDMLLKHQVITAYRSVIAISGTAPTMIDGIGNTRQRVGGHVCRVVGAVWLYQNLDGSPLRAVVRSVGSQAIARYIPNSPLHKQAYFAARSPPAFSADKVRQRVVQ